MSDGNKHEPGGLSMDAAINSKEAAGTECWWRYRNQTRDHRNEAGLPPMFWGFTPPLSGRLSHSASGPSVHRTARLSWWQSSEIFGFSLNRDMSEGALYLSVSLLFFTVMLAWEDSRVYKWGKRFGWGYEDRELSVGLDTGIDGSGPVLRWRGWSDPDVWRAKDPWWRNGSLYFSDLLFGQREMRVELAGEGERLVFIPSENAVEEVANGGMGGDWQRATYKIERVYHSRPRLPGYFTQRYVTGTITLHGSGYSHPGKGTTDYNCGDDAIGAYGCPLSSELAVEELVAGLVRAGEKNRRRYPL